MTVVHLEHDPDGSIVAFVEHGSPVVAAVCANPVVTLSFLAPLPFRGLGLTGMTHRLPDAGDRRVRYRVMPLSVRFYGAEAQSLRMGEYLRATPDPLAAYACSTLEHVGSAHAAQLLAFVRSEGYVTTEVVVPTAIDRYGLELRLVSLDGITTVRVSFPGGPISTPAEAGRAMSLLFRGCAHSED